MNLQTVDAEAGNRGTSNKKLIVPEKGFEPPRPCEQVILSHPCLPFHHSGRSTLLYPRLTARVNQNRNGNRKGTLRPTGVSISGWIVVSYCDRRKQESGIACGNRRIYAA